jgi:hypothetical protein
MGGLPLMYYSLNSAETTSHKARVNFNRRL